MAFDLRIRLLGRPQIENDSALGFQKITRKYAVEGPKVSKLGLTGEDDGIALFRQIGEPDEEFHDHYLISQVLSPGETIDSAILTRVFAQLRETWYSEQSSESGDLKKLTRKYVVLKNANSVIAQVAGNASLGYDDRSWSLHPKNGAEQSDNADTWDRLPELIKNTEPHDISYEDGDAVGSNTIDYVTPATPQKRRIIFPRVVKVLSNNNDEIEFEIQGAAPWKLGKQEFSGLDGAAIEDLNADYSEGSELVLMPDPRSATSLDDPATYDSSDPYTSGIESLVVGQSATVNKSQLKPVYPNQHSVNAQTEDGYIIETFEEDQRQSNFIEDLAIYENTVPQTEGDPVSENLYWVRSSASIDTSQAGVDVWTVSWVAPTTAHWRTGGSGKSAGSLPTIVAFDHHGLHTFKGMSRRQGGSAVFVFYTVQEQVPVSSSSYAKNGGSVSMDFKIQLLEGNNATTTFKQSFSNAAFYKTTRAHLEFPKYKDKGKNFPSGEKVVVACGSNCSHYNAGWATNSDVDIGRHLYFFWEGKKELEEGEHPMYQGKPVQNFGGAITYDATTWRSAILISPSSFKITPIHTHNTLKVWKVEVTYF